MKKISGAAIFRWIVCVGYGAMIGFFAITSADLGPGKTDNAAYQNFALIIGAAIGLVFCLIAHIIYRLTKGRFRAHQVGFVFALSITTGISIGLLSSYIVHISAPSYGMITAKTSVIIVATLISAIIGGLAPAVALFIFKS